MNPTQMIASLIRRGMTANEIVTLSGMSRWTVARWLAGGVPVSALHALELADIYRESVTHKGAIARLRKRAEK